jgi:hypothetical protein
MWGFASGAVPFLISNAKCWFSSFAIPYVHYIPVNYDLSNLIELIEWVQENDEEASQIAKNALEFAKEYFSAEFQQKYIRESIMKICNEYDITNNAITKAKSNITNKLLVLYVFYDVNERLEIFINNCIFYDDNVDFIIISNNKNNKFEVPQYVKKVYRDNIGFDFGGWGDVLITDHLYLNYDKFIFVNNSVKGPFLPCGYKGKWTDIYINGLKDNIKLFGSTINTIFDPLNQSHVQSYIFAMDKSTVEYLIECEIFSNTKYTTDIMETVYCKEVLMSRKIIEKGWNIGSLLPQYQNVDFTFKNKNPEDYNIQFLGDIMFNRYYGVYWKKEDLVFIKGNRITISV